MKKLTFILLICLTLFSCDKTNNSKNTNSMELKYTDCGLLYNNRNILLLSEIESYNLNLDGAKEISAYNTADSVVIDKEKNFEGLIIQWWEDNNILQKIIILETSSNKYETPRGIKVGSTIKEVQAKYGKTNMHDNKLSYWYGSLEFETQIGIIFTINDNKVEKIHIQSYD